MSGKSPESFEEALAQLESIVAEIESDKVKLEVALSKYQEGIALAKFCENKLKEVEQKVKILDPESGTLKDLMLE